MIANVREQVEQVGTPSIRKDTKIQKAEKVHGSRNSRYLQEGGGEYW